MKLDIIDVDHYRQFGYWQTLQKIFLPCAAGFTVAGAILEGEDVRTLCRVVALALWVFFAYAAYVARSIDRRMRRSLPPTLQSLLLFSAEGPQELPVAEAPAEPERKAGGE